MGDVERVFELWKSHRPNPGYCRLTVPRRKLITTRLKTYTAADLCTLVRYAFESDAAECRFWRGENDRRQDYTGLTNLLRVTKVDDRLERAMLWSDQQDKKSKVEEEGVDLGPMGRWS